MYKKILYTIVVFSIFGFGLYLASTFEYHGYYNECAQESHSDGGIKACVEFKIDKGRI
tara:strand:+ start:881 stop:1054 length:174 start_codon:yes stop_codon:yes gene_type:complete